MIDKLTAKLAAAALFAAATFALAPPAAVAGDYKAGAIVISHPWAPATPKGASVGAGYFKLTNTGTTPDRLLAATSAASGHADLHQMTMVNGVMEMRPIKGGIVLQPGETVELKPGGNHVMMMGLKQPLKQGERVKGTLAFEKAGTVDIVYDVTGPGGPAPAPGHASNTMQMHGGATMQMH